MRLAVLILALLTSQLSAAEKPNIVLIFCDDLAYGDIGSFGARGYATPHLDGMAKAGRRFTNFHVAQPICTASRAALLTGCYPNRIGLQGALGPRSRIGLNPDETTLAELLKQQGYATAIFGKWHLGDAPEFLPTRQGFDEFYGIPYSADMWPRHPEAKPGTYPPLPIYEGEKIVIADAQPADQEQLTTQYAERAVSFINRHKDAPFFLYLPFNMPHVPLFVSDKFRGKTERGLFGDVIAEIDWAVGQVLDALHANGLDDNTLVIFTSDNGPWLSYGDHAGSAAPLREGKGTTWEGGTRVPCLMRWPGKIPPGTDSAEMLMTIDLLPTIARLAGAALPEKKIDGLDIWPLLTGQSGAKNPHDAYYFYYGKNELQSLISGQWKLVFPHTYRTLGGKPGGKDGIPAKYQSAQVSTPQLYNLADDPSESHDLASEHPELVEKLTALATGIRTDLGDTLTGQKPTRAREPGQVGK